MAAKPEVTVESYPGVRGINGSTNNRWRAIAYCDGHRAEAWGATRGGTERKAIRDVRRLVKQYRRRVV